MDPRPTLAEVAQLVGLLEAAGIVEVFEDEDGQEAYRLTDDGVRLGHRLAIGDDEESAALLEALLGPGEPGTPAP